MDHGYRRLLERALEFLCAGADAVCKEMTLSGGVPRLNYMTGGYTWDREYVWDSSGCR
jgi:unsaturated chondroitin disaccharide hydrolase